MVPVKIWLLQLILFYQFYPPIATLLQRIIRGMYLYYNKKWYAEQKNFSQIFFNL